MKTLLIATFEDYGGVRGGTAVLLEHECANLDDLEERLREAAEDFARSEAGAYIIENYTAMNWGDFIGDVPDELLAARGLRITRFREEESLVVRHDETLIYESEVEK